MVYTVEDERGKKQTFDGFCTCSPQFGTLEKPPEHATILGIVQVEDSMELWWLENRDSAVEELQRYYRMSYGREMVIKCFAPA